MVEKTNCIQKLLQLDEKYSARLVIAEKPSLLRNVLVFLGHSCDSWYWLIGLALLWLFGNGSLRNLAAFWIFGLVLLAVWVLMMKFLIRRRRPEGEWGQIYRVTDPHSFPSGHAARAMAIAVMASEVGAGWLVAGLGVWAILVGISRVSLKLHYISDILVGGLLGLISGWVALAIHPAVSALFPGLF
ncbi:MAG: phosphatase PAP2 family protein [Anaerolineaceae bacterium]